MSTSDSRADSRADFLADTSSGMLLDSDAYSQFQKSHAGIVKAMTQAKLIYVPVIVVAEQYFGFENGSQLIVAENARLFEQFLAADRVTMLPADYQTARRYGELAAYLKARGTKIPINDLWIAALAVQYKLPVLSLDGHFDRLPQVGRVRV